LSVLLKKASASDSKTLYEIQIKSFAELLTKYQDYETNPGAEKIERTIHRLNMPNTDYYFILLEGINIGLIRIVRMNDLCLLKQICILPEHQGFGYAQQAIILVELLYPSAKHWELDTIKQESKLCHLYEKMGYKPTGKEEHIKEGLTLVFYRK
jgi:hypothetical protein